MDRTTATYTMKVNKVLNAVFWLGSLAEFVLYLIGSAPVYPSAMALIGAIVTLVMIMKNADENIISYVIAVTGLLAVGSLGIFIPVKADIIIVVDIILVALYLNKRLLLIVNVPMILILFYAILFIRNLSVQEILLNTLPCLFAIIGIWILTFWGSDLIEAAQKKEQETNLLLKEIETTMGVVKSSTEALNNDIENCNSNLNIVHTISESISVGVQEIAKGVLEQSTSLSEINERMKQGGREVAEIKINSQGLVEVAAEASRVVSQGANAIEQMDKQMGIINQVVNNSYSTVQELNTNMDEVNEFLSGITAIAGQTNLLALNAAIEAARAGESGRGFAVVADEVRKLAEQSAETANRINGVIERIKNKTSDILDQSQRGSTAAREGEQIADHVNQSFAMIQTSFKDINAYVEDEKKKIEATAAVLNDILRETENVASISEEHSASTEELTATIQEHNASIEIIYNLMKGIKESSNQLAAMAK